MQKFDISSICNALMDILVKADDSDIKALELNKGIMHLVDDGRQKTVSEHFHGKIDKTELGGSSLNAMRTLAGLGVKTSFAGMVGKDEYGDKIKKRMSDLNIDARLQTLDDTATGSCFILVTPDGERTMNTNLGASIRFNESLVPHEVIKNSRVFHFCGYQWSSEPQIKAIEAAIETAKSNGCLVSFDVADPFVVEQNREAFAKLIEEKADIVFANQEEAKLLYESDPQSACDRIATSGAIAVIKLGSEGALVGKGKDRFKISPVATKVEDTTAAGDMFAAGFLYGVLKDKSPEESGRIAATLASDVISRIGATVSDKALSSVRA